MKKSFRFVLLPLVVVFFLSAFCWHITAEVEPSKALIMSGNGWSISVDSAVQTAEVKSAVEVTQVKSTEKMLSVQLNSLDECKAGVVSFKVDTVGLSCYKQLPLTEQEIKDGAVRPENVVNSYACFDSSGRKVLHIYASKLIDAKGNSCWVDQTLKDGLLTVELNSTWLASAVFPVVLDPTFGYTSVGASSDSYGASHVWGAQNTFSGVTGSELVSMSVYVPQSGLNLKLALYADSGNHPSGSAPLANGTLVGTTAGDSWEVCDVLNSSGLPYLGLTNGVKYWLLGKVDGSVSVRYDSGASIQVMYEGSNSFAADWDQIAAPIDNGLSFYSLYATYDEGGSAQELALTINDPDNTTYTTSTIPVSQTVVYNESALQWNVKNLTDNSWVYAQNKTVATYSMTNFSNDTSYLFCCTAENSTAKIYQEIEFTVLITTASPTPTPTPTPTATPTAAPTATPVATATGVLDMNWLVFAFVVFGAVLCIIPARIFVVRVVVGMFGIVLAVTQLQNSALWFYPWSLVLWLFMSVCVLYSIWARTD